MGSKIILLEVLNWFHAAPTSPLVQMWIKTQTQNININDTNDPLRKYRLGMVSENILLDGLDRVDMNARAN